MTDFYKIGIAWLVIGILGSILYLFAEHIDGYDITLKNIIFFIFAGAAFGILIFTVSCATLAFASLTRLDKIILIQRRKKSND